MGAHESKHKKASKAGKILVIDDEADVLRYLSLVLEDNGYIALTADNVDDGLRILDEHRPDLVCLDLMMPRQSGIAFYRILRNQPNTAQTPVIMISGMSDPKQFDFHQLVPEAGVSQPEAYLDKPIKVPLLLETVQKLIERAKGCRRPH